MCGLDLHGAIFVLGDLPDRIKLRISEDVRRCLDIGKRDEDHPFLNASVSTSGEFDASQRRRMQARSRSRLKLVEHVGATGHGPRVPMFELAPRYQHQWELLVRNLGGRQHISRYESGAPGLGRKSVPKNNRLARVIWCRARIYD